MENRGQAAELPSASIRLQFGHDGEVVENDAAPGFRVWSNQELQFGHDGEVVENPDVAADEPATVQLQFGHDGEVVENAGTSPAKSKTAKTLQFGHDGEVVENVARHDPVGTPIRTSIRPRR